MGMWVVISIKVLFAIPSHQDTLVIHHKYDNYELLFGFQTDWLAGFLKQKAHSANCFRESRPIFEDSQNILLYNYVNTKTTKRKSRRLLSGKTKSMFYLFLS